MPCESVRFGTEILLAAFLDDIHFPGEVFLLRPFTLTLRELGPTIGLNFVFLSKKCAYISRVLSEEVRRLYPDASIMTDATPGTPKARFEAGARALGEILGGSLSRMSASRRLWALPTVRFVQRRLI